LRPLGDGRRNEGCEVKFPRLELVYGKTELLFNIEVECCKEPCGYTVIGVDGENASDE
jgi:hypothetical protein